MGDDEEARRLSSSKRRRDHHSSLRLHHFHLSFNVERLNSANRIAMMRKRKTIFGSFQSSISKWWWSGVILKSRRPVPCVRFVSLKKPTCNVTDSASTT